MKPRKEIIGNCTLHLGKMEDTIHNVQADHVLTDPPYLYIKTHDFDKEFNEQLLFERLKEMLPDNGFVALFGRGTSFYRWNTRLADLGFIFKEEIVWDKRYTTSPCMAISRVHENISIHSKKTGVIKRVKIPYLEHKQYDIKSIVQDINRIKSTINSEAGLNKIKDFLETGKVFYEEEYLPGNSVSQQPGILKPNRGVSVLAAVNSGLRERDIIYHIGGSRMTVSEKLQDANRGVKVLNSISGMNEKSVIALTNTHLNQKHPTEKPVRLAERILALISNEGDTIYDPFMGSGSFGVACINMNRKYIGSEMKPEYFNIAYKRIKEAMRQIDLFQEVS